jgi:hypothetical protein
METSSANAPLKSATSILQELDALYDSLRGAPYVTALIEAKKAFQSKDFVETLRVVRKTGDLHHQMHLQLLQQDPAKERRSKDDIQKIEARQAKVKGVLARFVEVAQQIEKLARVQPEEPKSAISAKPQPAVEPLLSVPISADFRNEFEAAESEAAQLRVVSEWFHSRVVEAEKYMVPGALFSLRHQGRIHLLRFAKRNAALATLTFESALSAKPLKPIPLETVLDLGAKQLLHRLLPKHYHDTSEEQDKSDDYTVSIINKGSFTQLQMAAQATGLLPNADAIGFVRDHEFRIKKYQEAFDRIEGIFIHLRTAADQRMQRLRQDEISYKSGTLKMTPKQWLMKQQRDTAQSQGILRALRYFTKVLDGLRILQTNPEAAPREEPTDV